MDKIYIQILQGQDSIKIVKFYMKKYEKYQNKLLESKFTNDEIDDIIIVGGSSKMPKITEFLEKKFNPS